MVGAHHDENPLARNQSLDAGEGMFQHRAPADDGAELLDAPASTKVSEKRAHAAPFATR
jgi:hypothetical protein